MLNIYLIRHGQDLDNKNGVLNGRRNEPLSERGVKQATELAQKIKDNNIYFHHVYSSPLKRVYKTAELITDELGIAKPVVLPGLIERDFGVMTGKRVDQIKELCSPDIIETEKVCYFLNPYGAETFPKLLKRVQRVLKDIQWKHEVTYKDRNVLLATHGDIVKMMYAAYYNIEWKEVLKKFHVGNTDLLKLSKDSRPESVFVFKATQYNH